MANMDDEDKDDVETFDFEGSYLFKQEICFPYFGPHCKISLIKDAYLSLSTIALDT